MQRNTLLAIPSAAFAFVIVIVSLTSAASAQAQYHVLYSFTGGVAGVGSDLTFDAVGNLYGTVALGGNTNQNCFAAGCGWLFKLSPQSDGSWMPTVLYSFSGPDGEVPDSALVLDSNGNIYGSTEYGGDYTSCPDGCGVVFELTPNADGGWSQSVLHSFSGGADGQYPASLISDAAGNLYGTAPNGGFGNVFKLAPNSDGTWTKTVLHSFTGGADGAQPFGRLIFDAQGNLFGTANLGGIVQCHNGTGCGTVFELSPNADGTWTETVLYTFHGHTDGSDPYGGLTFDSAGNLYGTASEGGSCIYYKTGCGVVFELTPAVGGGWTERVLHAFTFGKDGRFPEGSLLLDTAGNLYGTTHEYGGVFKLQRNAAGNWRTYELYSWPGNYALAQGDLVRDAAGNLYGIATTYGSSGGEEVYELTH